MELSACPKCDYDSRPRRQVKLGVLEVDIAHTGETWEQAKAKIDRAFDDALYDRHAGLKIIHGYGSRTGSSVIGPRAKSYLRHLAEETAGARFTPDRHTQGASIIWLNR